MAVQGQNTRETERTDNHVKRVCSNNTFLLQFTVILTLIGIMPSNVSAGDISCQSIRYKYFQKGLDTSDIPAAPQQGVAADVAG